jgi:uncharacterized protein (DUF58 family)
MPTLRDQIADWLLRRRAPETAPVRLTQRRIYILPTSGGLLLGATVLLMLMGCINYNLGLGYLLTFLLAGMAVVSILHTFRDLAHLELRPGRAESVFAGEPAIYPVLVDNPTPLARMAVAMLPVHTLVDETSAAFCDPAPFSQTRCDVHVPTHRRGRMRLSRLRVFTTYPLGLFHAWSYVELDSSCLIYPRPEVGTVPLPPPLGGEAEGARSGQGQDDFVGLRRYQPGDSLRQVAWKAYARGQPIMTKQFSGLEAGELWFTWADLPADMRLEARLSRLTRWVLEARRLGLSFGLDLPGVRIPPDVGPAHEERCLTALALFRVP